MRVRRPQNAGAEEKRVDREKRGRDVGASTAESGGMMKVRRPQNAGAEENASTANKRGRDDVAEGLRCAR